MLSTLLISAFLFAPAAPPADLADDKLAVVVIPVDGMSCAGCAGKVEAKLKKLDGVIDASVSKPKDQARVTYKSDKITTKQIIAAIKKLGYKCGEPTVPSTT